MTLDALTFPQTFCLDFLRVKSVPYRRNVSDLISGSKPQTRHLCVSWFSQVLLSFPNRPGLRSQLQSAEYDNISTGATQFGLVLLSLSLSFFFPPSLSLSVAWGNGSPYLALILLGLDTFHHWIGWLLLVCGVDVIISLSRATLFLQVYILHFGAVTQSWWRD